MHDPAAVPVLTRMTAPVADKPLRECKRRRRKVVRDRERYQSESRLLRVAAHALRRSLKSVTGIATEIETSTMEPEWLVRYGFGSAS
jgi:hypothetical protein